MELEHGTVRTPVSGSFKYAYDLRGQYQSLQFPNGQSRGYSFDDQGRVLQVSNTHPTTGNVATYSYEYDVDNSTRTGTKTMLGRQTSMTATVPSQNLSGALTKYYYDGSYRLSQVTYPAAAPRW